MNYLVNQDALKEIDDFSTSNIIGAVIYAHPTL
jgi:hypothetical protein